MQKLILLFFILFSQINLIEAKTGLPVPRFVSLRSDEVNVRVGPGREYPVEWVLKRREPVEIVAEFNNWRKIRCVDSIEGWVHQSMLSGRRLAMVKKETVLRDGAYDKASPVAKIKPHVIVKLKSTKGQWCKVDINDTTAWIAKSDLWGVYKNEKLG